jgi:hypothetical protein
MPNNLKPKEVPSLPLFKILIKIYPMRRIEPRIKASLKANAD